MVRAFAIDPLGICGNHLATHLARQLHDTAVGIQGILAVLGGVVVKLLIAEIALAECHDALHQRMVELDL